MKPTWVVCIKQVPREPVFKKTGDSFQIDRDKTECIMNPDDRSALDFAMEVREKAGGRIVVVSMGPDQAREALEEAVAYGADEAVLLSDPAFAGADTLATAFTLAAGIKKLGTCSLVVCGSRTLDSDTGQVGPQLAEFLDVPMAAYVDKVVYDKRGSVRVERRLDGFRERLVMQLPALITVLSRPERSRPLSLKSVEDTFASPPVTCWGIGDLGVKPARTGWEGSATEAREYAYWKRSRSGERFEGRAGEAADRILAQLVERGVLSE